MKRFYPAAIIAVAIVVCGCVLAGAYKFKYREQNTVVVTGLGEEEFTSDLIVWRGWIVTESQSVVDGYASLEENKRKVTEFLGSHGIAGDEVVFMSVDVSKNSEPVYQNGNYAGQRFTGYSLRQEFTVESRNIEAVENVSREITSLLAQGINLESWQPDYYYSRLDDLKLELIEKASADARARAERIAAEAGSQLGKLRNARMGVFQITGANTNEEFSAGGSFNTSSKNKKARITMRLEYKLR